MIKTIQIILFFLSFQAAFGQENIEQNLINALENYKKNKQENLENTYWQKVNVCFRTLIQNKKSHDFEFINLKKYCDSCSFSFTKFETENKKFIGYCLQRPDFQSGLNYVCVKTKLGFQIIYKDLVSAHQFFSGIENLSQNQFILFETRYDLVYGCNYATVFEYQQKLILKKAFGSRKKLTVCNFTSTEEPMKFDENGKVIASERPKNIPLIEIKYNRQKKTLYYGNPAKESKYVNGKFTIKDFDERKLYE
jgi:hypothetical protein